MLGRGNMAPITAHCIALADRFATRLARTDHHAYPLAHEGSGRGWKERVVTPPIASAITVQIHRSLPSKLDGAAQLSSMSGLGDPPGRFS